MTDIVYLLGSGSLWGNNEIRYSLRSVEKHLSDVGNVFVIGHRPDFLNVNHISIADEIPANLNKALNIKNKILSACDDERISDPFLVFSDDYFLLKDYSADSYPYFHRGTLENGANMLHPNDLYRMVYSNTMKVLRSNNLAEKHFNVHAPILYKKQQAKEAFALADWSTKLGFMSKSLYCNYMNIEGEYSVDCKISIPVMEPTIKANIYGKPFFSISDRALFRGRMLWNPLAKVFNELYPNKSKWENI